MWLLILGSGAEFLDHARYKLMVLSVYIFLGHALFRFFHFFRDYREYLIVYTSIV
jgi:hypothetical protein